MLKCIISNFAESSPRFTVGHLKYNDKLICILFGGDEKNIACYRCTQKMHDFYGQYLVCENL